MSGVPCNSLSSILDHSALPLSLLWILNCHAGLHVIVRSLAYFTLILSTVHSSLPAVLGLGVVMGLIWRFYHFLEFNSFGFLMLSTLWCLKTIFFKAFLAWFSLLGWEWQSLATLYILVRENLYYVFMTFILKLVEKKVTLNFVIKTYTIITPSDILILSLRYFTSNQEWPQKSNIRRNSIKHRGGQAQNVKLIVYSLEMIYGGFFAVQPV